MKLLVCYNKFLFFICNSDNIIRAHVFGNKLIKTVANLPHVFDLENCRFQTG